MGQLRDRMEADFRLAGYSPSTRKIYLGSFISIIVTSRYIAPPGRSTCRSGSAVTRQVTRRGGFLVRNMGGMLVRNSPARGGMLVRKNQLTGSLDCGN